MGSADNMGVLQCVREIITNSLDEYAVGYGDKLEIALTPSENRFSIRDYARSVPFGKRQDGSDALEAILFTPHTGAKYTDKEYAGISAGTNGIALKCIALSSEFFKIRSTKDGEYSEVTVENGDMKSHTTGKSSERTGTYIEFIPSSKVYYLEPIEIKFEDICSMCEDWSYLNKKLRFELTNKDTNETKVYYSTRGVGDLLLARTTSSLQKEPFVYSDEDEFGDKMEIAFLWGSNKEQPFVFTNGLQQVNGGTSLTGAKTAITRTINNLAGTSYTGEFIRSNLCYIINAKVPHASFSDQTKTKINNPQLKPLGDKCFTEALKLYAASHKDEFDKLLGLLSKIDKANKAGERARQSVLNFEKKEQDQKRKKINMPDKFKDCEKHGEDSILIICEGASALAGLMPARDVNKEALYAVRGKVKNLLKHPLDECLENQEVSDIILALGCGIQEKYNAKKLNFGKVAIAVDGDVDGFNIMCLIATLFCVLMPKFIEEGRLCWLRAPLYRLTKGKNRVFAYTEDELVQMKKGKYANWEQGRNKGLGEMTAEDMTASMLHPENRRLEVLTISDAEAAAQSIQMLMGTEVEPRRDFLFENVDFSILNN